jgi:hypothetical protein
MKKLFLLFVLTFTLLSFSSFENVMANTPNVIPNEEHPGY